MIESVRRLDTWVASGLITPEQARAIRAFEGDERGGGRKKEATPPPGRVPLVTEALGYLGAALAFAALVVALAQTWGDLAVWARAGIPAVCVTLLFIAGYALRENSEPAFERFGAALWFLSVVALGWFLFVFTYDVMSVEGEGENIALAMGVGTFAYGGVLYSVRRRAPQQVAMLAGALLAAGGFAARFGQEDAGSAWVGVAFWVIGVAWLVLAYANVIAPRVLGYALGAIVVLQGCQLIPGMSSGTVQDLGLFLGILSGAALVVASVWLREDALLVFGAIGLFGFLLGTIAHFFGETLNAPLVMLIAGLILLAVAVMAMRLRRFTGRTPSTDTPPAAPPDPAA